MPAGPFAVLDSEGLWPHEYRVQGYVPRPDLRNAPGPVGSVWQLSGYAGASHHNRRGLRRSPTSSSWMAHIDGPGPKERPVREHRYQLHFQDRDHHTSTDPFPHRRHPRLHRPRPCRADPARAGRRGLHHPHADPGAGHPAPAARARRARVRAHRHRQDGGLRAADPGSLRPRRAPGHARASAPWC